MSTSSHVAEMRRRRLRVCPGSARRRFRMGKISILSINPMPGRCAPRSGALFRCFTWSVRWHAIEAPPSTSSPPHLSPASVGTTIREWLFRRAVDSMGGVAGVGNRYRVDATTWTAVGARPTAEWAPSHTHSSVRTPNTRLVEQSAQYHSDTHQRYVYYTCVTGFGLTICFD
jgi:hypothetical protein